VAVELAQRYKNGNVVGQLAIVESADENAVLHGMIKNNGPEFMLWLGGGRDEMLISKGIFWSSYPKRNVQFYAGSPLNGGGPVAGQYTNFAPKQPDAASGGLAMFSNGTWFVWRWSVDILVGKTQCY
jgi:hypothetical protein